MKARPEGEIAVIEASWVRGDPAPWEARVARSGVRAGPHWRTLSLGEAAGAKLLAAAGHSGQGGVSWIVDETGCVLRANASGPIVREVLSSLLDDPQECGPPR